MRYRSLLFLAFLSLLVLAQPRALALERSSMNQYRTHLASLRALVGTCEAKAADCDAAAVGSDEQVQFDGLGANANTDSFEAHYGWLRDALKSAQNSGDENRRNEMQTAAGRLDEAAREASAEALPQTDFGAARNRVNAILGRSEFATVQEDSIWQRIWARIFLWLDRIFGHVAQFGEHSPWIGPVLEWGLIGIVLVGLCLWAMRVLRRQRLAVRVEAARQIEPWEEAARNWRILAEEQAARGEWREAVHCLYWASIALLEGRRLWTPNRSRTPREYVRLLEAGSTRWSLLRRQTQGFEHVWYGQHEAAQRDYDGALELHERLRAA